jgi:hypothetical protein
MRNLVAIAAVLFLSVFANRVDAQSLTNTVWKFYVEPLHDSMVFHIGTDSSFTTTSTGETVIRSFCKVEKDTLKIKDIDGQYFCPDGEGVYRWTVEGNVLNLFMVTDPCNDRAGVLNGIKCIRKEGK